MHPCIAKADKVLAFLKENIGDSILEADGADIVRQLQKVKKANEESLRRMAIHARVQKRLSGVFSTVDKKNLPAYLSDFIAGAGRKETTNMVSLERYIQGVTGTYFAKLSKEADRFRPKLVSFGRTRESIRNIVRAIFGETIQDADATAFAKLWKPVVEELRIRFNKAGGRMEYLDSWALPQTHDTARIAKAEFDKWFADVKDLLDRRKMNLALTGTEGDMSDALYKKVMQRIHASLASDGAVPINLREISPFMKQPMSSRHLEHRVMHFKNADSWLKYNDLYGSTDPFQSMMHHIEMMGREIGAMEMLGPNPDAMFEGLVKYVQGQTGKATAGRVAQKSYNNVMGKTFGPREKIGTFFKTIRHIQTGAKLPMAPVAALSDSGFSAFTAGFNGLPVFKVLGRTWRNILSGGSKDRQVAAALGLHFEYAMDIAKGANRFSELTGYGLSAKYADKMIRAGGLNHMTHAAQFSFGLEMLNGITRYLDHPEQFGKGSRLRKALARYGMDKHIDELRSAPRLVTESGAKYIDLPNMKDQTTAAKLIAAIKEETNYAVPEPGAKTRGILNQGVPANTVMGELIRSMTQFKSFPTTIVVTHLSRGINRGSLVGSLSYLAPLSVGLGILGMGVVQVKELLNGRTTYDWNDTTLIKKGFMQGGAWGLVGDMFLTDVEKYGLTSQFMQGPMFDFLDATFGDIAISGGQDLATLAGIMIMHGSRETIVEFDAMRDKYVGRVADVAMDTMPSTWYTKLMFDKSVGQYIRNLDPKYQDRTNRLEKKLNEEGREVWAKF